MRIRILLFTLMRIRIQLPKMLRIHADLDGATLDPTDTVRNTALQTFLEIPHVLNTLEHTLLLFYHSIEHNFFSLL
jgi:hypothetical protein